MTNPVKPSSSQDIQRFLQQSRELGPIKSTAGRLIFALDATASRQPTWDHACQLQGDMFLAATALGGLAVQLFYYRGYQEAKASPWLTDTTRLLQLMTKVSCLGGHTQIARLLHHAMAEHRQQKVQAVVFVGDCMEESADELAHLAGQMGILGLPLFVFQEGYDATAASTFKQLARLSGGAFHQFDQNSASQLKDLLSAVAVYAAGGRQALEDFEKRQGRSILRLE